MKRYSLLLASASAAMLAPAIPVSAAPAAAAQGEDAHARLTALFHESDEASLKRNPVRVKRVAFGFKRFRNYRIRTLLYAGKPNWTLLPTVTPR